MRHGLPFVLFTFLLIALVTSSLAQEEKPRPPAGQEQATVEDVIPLTVGNLRGHAMLYNEGWFVVTSSKKAFAFARERALMSSKEAIQEALAGISQDTADYSGAISTDIHDAAKTGKDVAVAGTKLSGRILTSSHELGKSEFVYAKESFQEATESFVRGNLSIVRRTEADRKELAGLPGNYFRTLKSDFSNLYDLTARARERFSGKIGPQWEKSFQRAGREFQAEYEASGRKHNTLTALGPILAGYLKSLYHGLAVPASKTIV